MTDIVNDWLSWNTLGGITGTLTAGTAQISNVLDLDLFSNVAVSVILTYGVTVSNGGVLVQVLRDLDGTNYEDQNSAPRQFTIPAVASTRIGKAFTISGALVSSCKVRLLMPSGNSNGTTVEARYKFVKTVTV